MLFEGTEPAAADAKVDALGKQLEDQGKATQSAIENITKTQLEITQTLKQMNTKPAPQKDPGSIADEMFTNPAAYTEKVKAEAKQEALVEMQRMNQAQQQVNNRIVDLVTKYPDLSKADTALTKKAVEILSTSADKQSPEAYEYAVLKAAAELGVQPRQKGADDFVRSQSGGSDRRLGNVDRIVKETESFSKAIGLDMSDPKTKKAYEQILREDGIIE